MIMNSLLCVHGERVKYIYARRHRNTYTIKQLFGKVPTTLHGLELPECLRPTLDDSFSYVNYIISGQIIGTLLPRTKMGKLQTDNIRNRKVNIS